jgi:hypothetical protein
MARHARRTENVDQDYYGLDGDKARLEADFGRDDKNI